MSRRALAVWFAAAVAGVLPLVAGPSGLGSADPAGAAPLVGGQAAPNVVLLLLDDARYDDMSTLPEVARRVGDQGATFTRFYSSFPLCCPARATLLTGQYPHNHGVLSNVQPSGGFKEFRDASTLATWLDPTYRTGLIGKYFNQYAPPYQPPGWDEWMVPAATYNYTGSKWYLDRGAGGAYTTMTGYQTDRMADLSVGFIQRNAPSDQPFFLYTGIVAPHAGSPADPDDISGFPTPYVDPKYRDRFAGMRPRDPAFNEADVSDKPLQPSALTSAEVAGLTETNAQRREASLSAQDAITRVLDALEASGELDDTYVVFMSDNGYILGEHRIRGGKLAPYEVANRIPMMVRGPGITPGTVIDDTSAQVDFAPTVMAMAGQPIPSSVDGQNLLPRLRDPAAVDDTRRAVVIEATNVKATTDPLPWLYHGVVSGSWKYIERENGKKELYNLNSDPSELTNLAGDPAYSAKRSDLAALLTTYRWCRGAACR